MPPGEGIRGTSYKAHLPLLWQLLFLVKGNLQNLENTRKFQGKNFYPQNRNHKLEEIYPPQGKQSLLPCGVRVSFCLYLHTTFCPWWAHGWAWPLQTLWVYLLQIHLSLEIDPQTSSRIPRFLIRRCLAQLWQGRWGLTSAHMASTPTPRFCSQFKRQILDLSRFPKRRVTSQVESCYNMAYSYIGSNVIKIIFSKKAIAQYSAILLTSGQKISNNLCTQCQVNKYKSSSNTTIKTQNKKKSLWKWFNSFSS